MEPVNDPCDLLGAVVQGLNELADRLVMAINEENWPAVSNEVSLIRLYFPKERN